jgi:chromosome partitioning protein
MSRSGKIISVMNFKGGVGKTTLSVNFAACLAKEYGKEALLVDLDPQSNASIWLLGEPKWKVINKRENIDRTAVSLFKNKFNRDHILTPFDNPMSRDHLPRLSVLPASFHMIELESAIFKEQVKLQVDQKYKNGSEYRYLGKVRKTLNKEFDYVIIDCPPNLYNVTRNALFHSDYILIPCIPNALSSMGLKLLLNHLEKIIQPFAAKMEKKPQVLGVAVTRYDSRLKDHSLGIKAIESAFRSFREENPNSVIVNGRTTVFHEYPIRDYAAHSEAVQNHQPVGLYQELSKAYSDVKANTQALIEAMEGL